MKTRTVLSNILMVFVLSPNCLALADSLKALEPILRLTPEGRSALVALRPGGSLSAVNLRFLPAEAIRVRAGHTGGGVKQDPVTKTYEILINEDLPNEQKVHAILHEVSHVQDELQFDKFLQAHPDLDVILGRATKGVRGPDRESFIESHFEDVVFLSKGLFCAERRAYRVNQRLVLQGFPFANEELLKDPSAYINASYLKRVGVTYSAEALKGLEAKCLSAPDFVSYIKTIVPKNLKSQPGITTEKETSTEE